MISRFCVISTFFFLLVTHHSYKSLPGAFGGCPIIWEVIMTFVVGGYDSVMLSYGFWFDAELGV